MDHTKERNAKVLIASGNVGWRLKGALALSKRFPRTVTRRRSGAAAELGRYARGSNKQR
jgi:hypothetical protein